MIHCYKQNGYNIVLDAASGSIHCVDDVAFEAIEMLKSAEHTEKIIERLTEKFGARADVTERELRGLLAEIEGLRKEGKLFAPDILGDAPVRAQGKTPLKALCLNVAHTCNMSCSYCFAQSEFGHGEDSLMTLETGKRAIAFLAENSGTRKNLEVDFFGGEPLLNWEVVKGIVGYARELEADTGKRFRFTLTTNGLLIDDEVIDFVNREMRNVVLSLDGRPQTHDRYRRLGGGGSYSAVLPGIKRLVEARGGKDYYIRGTYTRQNLDFTRDIFHMAELGFTELSIEPVVAARSDTLRALTEDDLPKIFEEYELLAAEMLKRRLEGRGFNFYHFTLDLTHGPCVYKRVSGCGSGTEYLAVTPRGDFYACHQLIGNPDFHMGDIWRGVTNSALRGEFMKCDIYTRKECRDCWARLYCSGGCAANAYNASGSIGGVYELGCELLKKRIECAVMMKAAEASEAEFL